MESSNFISKNLFLCSCISLLGFIFLLLMCFNHQGQYYGTSSSTLLSFNFSSDSIQTPSSSDHERRKFSSLQEASNMGTQGKDALSFNFSSDSIQTPSSSDHERRKFSSLQETSNMGTQGKDAEEEISRRRTSNKCDWFDGRWVDDPNGRPLYHASQCPFLSDQVSCQRNGRPDAHYEKWIWEASQCAIPRFDGLELLERWRGKRVAIVGDSLNRNQWESLACLLYSAISPSRAYVNVQSPTYKVFRALDYNCIVEFFWSPFLVRIKNRKKSKVLRLDSMCTSATKWRGAHIMIFNTGHWWAHQGKLKAWNSFEYKGKLVEDMEVNIAFGTAMKTWAQWVDKNVNPTVTTVFFRSISPEHKTQKNWCHNQRQPLTNLTSHVETFPSSLVKITEQTIKEMNTRVQYLNITRMSKYRRDAHPSVYTSKQGKLLTVEQQKQPKLYADCSHWCLPGLPDTWNTLVYAMSNITGNSIKTS